MDKEFKIPTSYIETGEVSSVDTTPFQSGDVLEFHRSDLRPVDAIQNEAVNFAAETPETSQVNIFEFEPTTALQEVDYAGRKIEKMRKDRAGGVEIEALAVAALRTSNDFDKPQFGLTA